MAPKPETLKPEKPAPGKDANSPEPYWVEEERLEEMARRRKDLLLACVLKVKRKQDDLVPRETTS